jgi:hypothetical protein
VDAVAAFFCGGFEEGEEGVVLAEEFLERDHGSGSRGKWKWVRETNCDGIVTDKIGMSDDFVTKASAKGNAHADEAAGLAGCGKWPVGGFGEIGEWSD